MSIARVNPVAWHPFGVGNSPGPPAPFDYVKRTSSNCMQGAGAYWRVGSTFRLSAVQRAPPRSHASLALRCALTGSVFQVHSCL